MEDEIVKVTMVQWTRNVGRDIHMENWEQLWKMNSKLTKVVSLNENMYKKFYRWHIAPDKLAKMYPGANNKCWKCKDSVGTFYHMWWTYNEEK